MNTTDIICLGEALVDRLGALGQTNNFNNNFYDCLGGAPANVACGLARLGKNVSFIGCLGNDSIGDQFQNLFESRRVNLDALQINFDLPTRIVLVKRDYNGERTFGGFFGPKNNIFADQALELNKLKEQLPLLLDNASWLLMGTIPLAFEASRESALWAVDKALEEGKQIAIDLNWRPTFWDQNLDPDSGPNKEQYYLIRSFLENASLLKLAKEEALWFFNSEDPLEISNLLSKNPIVIITDGSNPIKWIFGEFVGTTSAFLPVKIIDTTGAGDAFMSGIMSKVITFGLPKDFNEAESIIKFAAACGAFVCTGKGAIDPQPRLSDVEDLLS